MQKFPFALISQLLLICLVSASPLPEGLNFTSPLPENQSVSLLSTLSFTQSGQSYQISSQNKSVLFLWEGKFTNSSHLCPAAAGNCQQNLSLYLNEGGNFIFAGTLSYMQNATLPPENHPVSTPQIFPPVAEKDKPILPLPGYWPIALSFLAVIGITAYHFLGKKGY